MTNDVKSEIASAANTYIQRIKGYTASKFATDCQVNKSYISNILNGTFTTGTDDAIVDIPEKYFVQIANFIKFRIEKSYWPERVATREFTELMFHMRTAKELHTMKMLFVETGAGKTNAAIEFKKEFPLHTYDITMHSELTINDMFNELARQLDIPLKGTKGYRRAQVIIKLREIRRNGGNPIVKIDEGENMNTRMRATIKGFYDGILGYASIVVLGTPDLRDLMEDAKASAKAAGPQIYRRFRAGMVSIKVEQSRAKRFRPFFDALADMGFPIEPGLQQLLCDECDNYGVLHDFLEPALRMADKKGKLLTEEMFRIMYDMPKRQKAA